jgi:hypothetical protein
MKLKNAIKKLQNQADEGTFRIHEHADGKPWMASGNFGKWVVEFLANGRWHDDADITCIKVRKHNDHDDSMTDYSAGSFRDTLTAAIKSAKRLSKEG